MALSEEVRETLARHGLSASDIEQVERFEAEQKAARRNRPKPVEQPTLF